MASWAAAKSTLLSLEKAGFLRHPKGSAVGPLKQDVCSPGPFMTAVNGFSALVHHASQGHPGYMGSRAGQVGSTPHKAHCQPPFPPKHGEQGRQIASLLHRMAGGRFTYPRVVKKEDEGWVLKPLGSLWLWFAIPKAPSAVRAMQWEAWFKSPPSLPLSLPLYREDGWC